MNGREFSLTEISEILQIPRAMVVSWVKAKIIKPDVADPSGKKTHYYFKRGNLAKMLILKALEMKAGVRISRCREHMDSESESYTLGNIEIVRIRINHSKALEAVDQLINKKSQEN